jgi:hypothetical protein
MSTTSTRFQDQSIDLVRQSQDAIVDGIRAWTEVLRRTTPAWQAAGWPVRPEEAVDAVFDIAEQTLATQRQIARQVWGATATVAETAAEQTPKRQAEKRSQPDYDSMTVEQLQDEAAKAEIEGRSQMNKQELVKALRKQ